MNKFTYTVDSGLAQLIGEFINRNITSQTVIPSVNPERFFTQLSGYNSVIFNFL